MDTTKFISLIFNWHNKSFELLKNLLHTLNIGATEATQLPNIINFGRDRINFSCCCWKRHSLLLLEEAFIFT